MCFQTVPWYLAGDCENVTNPISEELPYVEKTESLSVQDEIEHLNDYISIMKSRYRQKIEFDIHVYDKDNGCGISEEKVWEIQEKI